MDQFYPAPEEHYDFSPFDVAFLKLKKIELWTEFVAVRFYLVAKFIHVEGHLGGKHLAMGDCIASRAALFVNQLESGKSAAFDAHFCACLVKAAFNIGALPAQGRLVGFKLACHQVGLPHLLRLD